MITSKIELKEYIQNDNDWYKPVSIKDRFIACLTKSTPYHLKRYLYYLRKQEYYINTASKSKFKGMMGILYERKKNKLGISLGIEIGPNCFGKGLQIYHGNIVVNPSVRAGSNCKLHGNNCIGNNGKIDISPNLGNNVDIGFGAILIGDIQISDNTIIGANAVLNRSISTSSCVIVGVPGKIVKHI